MKDLLDRALDMVLWPAVLLAGPALWVGRG